MRSGKGLVRGALVMAGGLALTACASDEGSEPLDLGRYDLPIINGDLDTERDAVVFAFSNNGACTGTIIHRSGSNAYVLTAAHCFGGGALQNIVIADDVNQATQSDVMPVADYEVHPQYNPNGQNLTYDFAMMRVVGADASTPIIPALSPAEDNLQVGTPLTHVGYGKTAPNDQGNSQRRRGSGTIAQLGEIQIAYNQNQGPCQGDSGGPDLVDTPAGERVAGVVSFGDQNCAEIGVSGRASAVYDTFIVPFIGEDPTGSVASSTSAATGGGVGGMNGAGGAGVVGGVGANDPGTNWSNGLAEEEDYDDIQVSSGCATSGRDGSGDSTWLVALALGAVALRRRRSVLSEPRSVGTACR